MLEGWHEAFGPRLISTRELLEAAQAVDSSEGNDACPVHPALTAALEQMMGESSQWDGAALGYRLRSWSGRIQNGFRLMKEGKSTHGVRWRVREVRKQSHQDNEDWDARVKAWLDTQPADAEWTSLQVLEQALGYAPEDYGRSELTRMGHCLRRLGLVSRETRSGGRQLWGRVH